MEPQHLKVLTTAIVVLWPLECWQQPDHFDGGLAHAWVERLAADSLAGRRTGTAEGDEAARLVAEAFEEAGLEPAGDGDSYLHHFTFPFYRFVQPVRLAVGKGDAQRSLVYGEDFFFLNGSSATSGEGEVVFAGYGLSTPELDELAGLDVRGKVLLAFEGLPPHLRIDRSQAANINKAKRARELGAAGLLVVSDPAKDQELTSARIWVFRPNNYLPGFFLARVDVGVAEALLEGRTSALKEEVDRDGRGARATGRTVSWQVSVEYATEREGANVLGMLPGNDPALAHELVLVGAHYDGGGSDPDGSVYNGAEDNASGTAAVIELARIMAAAGPSARPVMFAAWGAEEQGAWGSKRFLEQAYWPLDEIVFTLTLDNVGVGDGRFHLYGARNFPEEAALVRSGVSRELFSRFTLRGAGGSDGWSFQVLGIPALFAHADAPQPFVHTPDDDDTTVSPEMLEVVGRFSEQALRAAADAPAGSYDRADRLARYLWRYGFVVGSVDAESGSFEWEGLRERGFDLVVVEPMSEEKRAELLASVPDSVTVVSGAGELSSREEGAPLRVLFLHPKDLAGGPERIRVTAQSELPALLKGEADVALVFDVVSARPRDHIRDLVAAGLERERIETLLDRLRAHLALHLGSS